MVSVVELRADELPSYPKFFQRKLPEPLRRGRFLSALESSDSVAGDGAICEAIGVRRGESDPAARDFLAKRYCAGWAVASEEYRKNLKKLYAELEEPARLGRTRSGRTEGREIGTGSSSPY